jgi:Reverse transcriptase (RNA-dependent DNA polymerase)
MQIRESTIWLKQSTRAWFEKFYSAMRKYEYTQSDTDHTSFYRKRREKIVVLIIYVDDLIITCEDHIAFQHNLQYILYLYQ